MWYGNRTWQSSLVSHHLNDLQLPGMNENSLIWSGGCELPWEGLGQGSLAGTSVSTWTIDILQILQTWDDQILQTWDDQRQSLGYCFQDAPKRVWFCSKWWFCKNHNVQYGLLAVCDSTLNTLMNICTSRCKGDNCTIYNYFSCFDSFIGISLMDFHPTYRMIYNILEGNPQVQSLKGDRIIVVKQ